MHRLLPLALLAPALAPAIAPTLAAAQPVAKDAAPASATRAMTFEDVLAVRAVSDAQISPDGRWVAYVVARSDTTDNATNADLWLVRADGSAPPQRLTTHPKNDQAPRWSPDGTRLAFVSAREERPQLFVMSPFGGEPERLTDSKTGVRTFAWAPDGKRIAYVADRAPTADEERRRRERDDAIVVDSNYAFARLWVLDVETRRATELVSAELTVSDPQWSPDGTRIAYVAHPTPRADDGPFGDVWVVGATAGSAPRKLFENEGPDAAPRWSPDGRSLVVLTRAGSPREVGMPRLAVVPAEGGTPRVVAPDFLYQAGAATWSPDGRTLYFPAATRTTSNLFAVPASGGTPRALLDGRTVVADVSLSRDAGTVALVRTDVRTPRDVWVVRLTARGVDAPRRVTDHNPEVRTLALGRSEVLRYKGPGGLDVEGIVVYPPDYVPGRAYPTVVQVHGGPAGVWAERFPDTYGSYAHVWAGRGWVVFQPNPRGSTGYGEPFLRANLKDWGGGDYGDIQAGLDTLVARGVADADRLAQVGWSYGGYMTAWTITQTTRFKAAMVGAGITNLYSMYSTNDLPGTIEGYFGGRPWDDREGYAARSAMTFVKNARTPTLILHGQQDLRVPLGQAQELYVGLRDNRVPTRLVLYPREPHGLGEPRHQLDKMRREYAWIAEHTLAPARALVP